jgi:hypothetical protein
MTRILVQVPECFEGISTPRWPQKERVRIQISECPKESRHSQMIEPRHENRKGTKLTRQQPEAFDYVFIEAILCLLASGNLYYGVE